MKSDPNIPGMSQENASRRGNLRLTNKWTRSYLYQRAVGRLLSCPDVYLTALVSTIFRIF